MLPSLNLYRVGCMYVHVYMCAGDILNMIFPPVRLSRNTIGTTLERMHLPLTTRSLLVRTGMMHMYVCQLPL